MSQLCTTTRTNMMQRTPRLSKKKQNTLLRFFIADLTAAQAASLAKVNKNTAGLYYRNYRELIYQSQDRAPRLFGEVEMDQSFFGGRGGAEARKALKQLRKEYLPRDEYDKRLKAIRLMRQIQVFGIKQREGVVYVRVIKKADRNTLMPIIRLVVEQGSTVYTDKWRGFVELGLDGYTHKSINHSLEYSDKKGTHINGIEQFWSFAKRRLAKFNGLARTTLQLHLKESEFRYNHRADLAAVLKSLLN